MRIYLTSILVAFICYGAHAQQEPWRSKIDSSLWQKVLLNGKSDFLIILAEQGDVGEAAHFRLKADKGRYVYQTLSSLAERSQAPLKKFLDDHRAPWLTFWIINGMWSEGNVSLIEQLAQMPIVAKIEDNPVIHMQLVPQGNQEVVADRYTTNSNIWGLQKIKADAVWNLGYTGSGVVVAGHDTGYEWQHPAIKDKYRGWDGTTADHNYNWHDAIHALINGGTNSCGLNLMAPCDDDNHGTHTMGTMTGGDTGDNVIGVAPDAKWMGCRNMEEGDGMPSTYIECFQWFIAPTNLSNGSPDPTKAPDVINNSWGCPTSEGCNSSNFATMDSVVNNVVAAGIVVVVSAGNSGPSCSSVNTPAPIYLNSFSVGATQNTTTDLIASFSSRGPVTNFGATHMKPDVCAPGVNIYSCIGNSNNSGSYTYASWAGTSMAGPHVAGTVALILSARPDLKGQVSTIRDLIKNHAVTRYATAPFCGTDNATAHPNNVYGYGRIDALAAVNAALALPIELKSFNATKSGQTAVLLWSTASESDCARFDLQRSPDGKDWQTIGAVACHGNPAGDYQYTDDRPEPGINYYRLKQIDVSGAFAYSDVRAVAFSVTGVSITTLVNPTDQTVRFRVAGDAGQPLTLSIFQTDGKRVYEAPYQHQILNMASWASGIYLATLYNERGEAVATGKMVR